MADQLLQDSTVQLIVIVLVFIALLGLVRTIQNAQSTNTKDAVCAASIVANSNAAEKTFGKIQFDLACKAPQEQIIVKDKNMGRKELTNAVAPILGYYLDTCIHTFGKNTLSTSIAGGNPVCLVCRTFRIDHLIKITDVLDYFSKNFIPGSRNTFKEGLKTAWGEKSFETFFIKPIGQRVIPLPGADTNGIHPFQSLLELRPEITYYILGMNALTTGMTEPVSHIFITSAEDVSRYNCDVFIQDAEEKITKRTI